MFCTREFNDLDLGLLNYLGQTIDTLRRMRGAGNIYGYLEKGIIAPDEILKDARFLTESAAEYLTAYVYGHSNRHPYLAWLEGLGNLEAKYLAFAPVATGGDMGGATASRILKRLKWRNQNNDSVAAKLYLNYLNMNNIHGLNISDFTEGVGIVSPLSVDYLEANCFSQFIRQRFQEGFPPIQPVLLDANKKEVRGGDQPDPRFAVEKRVVILLDVVGLPSGTMQSMDLFARRCYPSQYKPQYFP
jgi:hypothetical protein